MTVHSINTSIFDDKDTEFIDVLTSVMELSTEQ
jgi:hypothetical protein